MPSNYNLLKANVNNLNSLNVIESEIPWNLNDPKPEKEAILGIVHAFNPAEFRVLNIILLLCSRYKLVYTSQNTIARMAKVARETVTRITNYLVELGLIAKKWNGHNKPCWYKASSWFKNLFVQESLSKKLPIFYFTLMSLLSSPKEEITRCIKDLNPFYKTVGTVLKEGYVLRKEDNKKKGEQMFEVKKEISDQVRNLKLPFTEVQRLELSQYDPKVITRADERLKENKTVKEPVRYFFWLCNQEKANPTTAFKSTVKKETQQEVRKPVAWKNTENPKQERTAEFIRSEIQKIKNHTLAQSMTAEGMLFGVGSTLHDNIIKKLEDELALLERESNTTNETYEEQPSYQPEIKESPTVKIYAQCETKKDYVDYYRDKYKNHEQSQQISDWLDTINVDDNNFEEVLD